MEGTEYDARRRDDLTADLNAIAYFLNLGGGQTQFADISGACGLDLMDDGRAIAVTDWDFDGKLDFWISNRTAPRIRLQNNRSQTRNNFVSVRLIGKSCNRDAVGARVELLLEGTPSKQILTLRAGEGFLAQSSKWIHFGIAEWGADQRFESSLARRKE